MTKESAESLVDSNRLWKSIEAINDIGRLAGGGVCRLALTKRDISARQLLATWCEKERCTIKVDSVGNMFIRREGQDCMLPPVSMGSHLDTQPSGGRYDGIYGVMAGLEVIRSLNGARIATKHPIELIVWANEEGARFKPPMMGSGAFAGVFSEREVLTKEATDDKSLYGDNLFMAGLTDGFPVGSNVMDSYFELHIEQGPVLEHEKKSIGVVSGIQGIRWFEVCISGQEAHAGPTPMALRRDPVNTFAEIAMFIRSLALKHGTHARATVACISSYPESRNTVPGRITFSVDVRHPDGSELDKMTSSLGMFCQDIGTSQGTPVLLKEVWHSPPVLFDPACVEIVRNCVQKRGFSNLNMVSGAGHDAGYVAKKVPTAMIFIPCLNGLSHNEAESITQDDAARGCKVLFDAVRFRANQVHSLIDNFDGRPIAGVFS